MAEAQAIDFGTPVVPGTEWENSPQPVVPPVAPAVPAAAKPQSGAKLASALRTTPPVVAPKLPVGPPPPSQTLEQMTQDPTQILSSTDPAQLRQTALRMGLQAGDEQSLAKKKEAENAVNWQRENTKISERMVEDSKNVMEARKRDMQEASPFAPTQESARDLASIFSLLSVAAFGSGGKGKYAGMQALSAMTGAMKGYKEGQKAIYDKEVKIFEENLQVIKSHNEKVERIYRDAMDLLSKNKEAGEQKIKELQAIDNTGIIAQLARSHKYQQLGEAIKVVGDATQKAQDKVDALKEKHADKAAEWAHQERMAREREAHAEKLASIRYAPGINLSGMTPQDIFKSNVDGIANYAINPKDFPIKERSQILAAVRQVNPSYQEGDFNNRSLVYRNWTNPQGTGGKQIGAFNTVASHLSTLQELGDAMNSNNIPLQNSVFNWFSRQGGHPEVTNFNSAKQAVAAEVVKAINGTSGALADREEAQRIFSEVKSPEQLRGAISTIKQLINGRLETSRQLYETGTGRKDFDQLLSPIVRKEFIASKPDEADAIRAGMKGDTSSPKDSAPKTKATAAEVEAYAKQHYGGDVSKATADLKKKGYL